MQFLHVKLEACRKCGRVLLSDAARKVCRCGHDHGGDMGQGHDPQLMSETRYTRRFWRVPYREVPDVRPADGDAAEG